MWGRQARASLLPEGLHFPEACRSQGSMRTRGGSYLFVSQLNTTNATDGRRKGIAMSPVHRRCDPRTKTSLDPHSIQQHMHQSITTR